MVERGSIRRIVSLVPSTTETVFTLGAGDRVVGVTRFCVHPREARTRAGVVGGTKTPSLERILTLAPDVVLANQEENRKEDIERLREHLPVHLAFPRSVPEAVSDILLLGDLLGEGARARELAEEIESARRALGRAARPFRYLYFIWRRPYMVAGPDTFIDALLGEAGGFNAAPGDRGRYPEVSAGDIESSGAEALLLASEPFPFEEEHRGELVSLLGDRLFGSDAIRRVDGELLSWHGTRLRHGLPYLRRLIESLGEER